MNKSVLIISAMIIICVIFIPDFLSRNNYNTIKIDTCINLNIELLRTIFENNKEEVVTI